MCMHQPPAKSSDCQAKADTEKVEKAVHPRSEYEEPATVTSKAIGVLYILSLFIAALAMGYFVLVPTALVIALWSPVQAQKVYRILLGLFCAYASGVFEYLNGMDVVVTGEAGETFQFNESDRVLLISNHRTEIDWMLHWNFATKIQCHDRIMTMMKAVLKQVPVFGGVLRILGFPFVERNWTEDEATLGKLVASYHDRPYGAWLAMFPEGTALFDKTLASSQAFEAANDRPICQFVLEPRLKGFELCVAKFQPDYILDVTMAFPELRDGVRPSPLRLLRGQFPKAVHFYARRFTRDDIMAAESPAQWLQDRFADKEELLSSFYSAEKGTFADKQVAALPDAKWTFYKSLAVVVAFTVLFSYVLWSWQYSWMYLAIVLGTLVATSRA
ncbi:hypothetical protein AeMF1_001933 [Aphanomyces euteiches]|nr:hypothetical protein AeMF1_001933 [Aphanomyces euteiches]KAH9192275.1 hypothetical protein AeNC1_005754 [Aphanomyces euteiches]